MCECHVVALTTLCALCLLLCFMYCRNWGLCEHLNETGLPPWTRTLSQYSTVVDMIPLILRLACSERWTTCQPGADSSRFYVNTHMSCLLLLMLRGIVSCRRLKMWALHFYWECFVRYGAVCSGHCWWHLRHASSPLSLHFYSLMPGYLRLLRSLTTSAEDGWVLLFMEAV